MALRIRIVCPEHSAYDADAAFVSIPSTDGNLGVAPHHANEICTIEPGFVTICDEAIGQVSHTFAVDVGYAEVTGDEVVILAERAQDLSEPALLENAHAIPTNNNGTVLPNVVAIAVLDPKVQ